MLQVQLFVVHQPVPATWQKTVLDHQTPVQLILPMLQVQLNVEQQVPIPPVIQLKTVLVLPIPVQPIAMLQMGQFVQRKVADVKLMIPVMDQEHVRRIMHLGQPVDPQLIVVTQQKLVRVTYRVVLQILTTDLLSPYIVMQMVIRMEARVLPVIIVQLEGLCLRDMFQIVQIVMMPMQTQNQDSALILVFIEVMGRLTMTVMIGRIVIRVVRLLMAAVITPMVILIMNILVFGLEDVIRRRLLVEKQINGIHTQVGEDQMGLLFQHVEQLHNIVSLFPAQHRVGPTV